MATDSRAAKALRYSLPSLAAMGAVGALGYLRDRVQHRHTFRPERFPNGIWQPGPFGLPADDVWFRAGDGTELHGWWVPHRRARGTLLYCHGNTGSLAQQIGVLVHLRRLQVNLFAFDYRGYGRSSGRPSEEGLYLDVRAAFARLVEELGQPAGSIILVGHSLGGAVAIDGALDLPAAGLVVQSSFTDLKQAAKAAFPSGPLPLLTKRRFTSIDKVARITLPKLFIHGRRDETVPFGLGRALFEAAAEPKELYAVPRAGHNDVHRHGGLRYLYRLSRFRIRCLRG